MRVSGDMYLFGYIFAHVHLQKYKFQLEILDSIFILFFFLIKSILNTFHTTIQFSKLKKTNLSHIVSVQCKIN